LDNLRTRLAALQSHLDGPPPAMPSDLDDINQDLQAVADGIDRVEDEIRRLQATEAQFRGLLESAPDAIITIDETGQILLANAQTEKMFGYPKDALLNQPLEILLPERVRARHLKHRAGYQAAPYTRPMGIGLELSGRRQDGSEFPVEISLSPFQTDNGVLVTAIVRDQTGRKQAEQALAHHAQELARSNAELEQFAYVASHDLQEPLRMVASYTQLLARRYRGKLDSDADEFIHFAVDGATRMQALIQDLLTYSRVGSRGKEFGPVELEAVFDRAVANLQRAIDESGTVVTPDPLSTVRGDDAQLVQLFQNLIGNAVKFRGSAPPQVRIGVMAQDNEWTFSVQDNGIGIESEYVDRIFVIFQRLHGHGEYPGTGIGLAICKKIVERHGGRIGVESQPGRGSTFFFTLPQR
jgi:PAS domain S-box-containing protein